MSQFVSKSSLSRLWREAAVLASVAAIFLSLNLTGIAQEAHKSAESTKTATAGLGGSKKGDQIFHTRCVVCHNKQPGDTSPFGPPNLYQAFKSKSITPPQAEVIITHGKGQMPAFGTILSKGDVQSVIAYLKTAK